MISIIQPGNDLSDVACFQDAQALLVVLENRCSLIDIGGPRGVLELDVDLLL